MTPPTPAASPDALPSQPRIMVAAPASGQGKTTLAVGLMAALRDAGHVVAAAKVGPDYIDPGYHVLATGRPSRNLDAQLTSPDTVTALLRRAACVPSPADVTVVEGVMGLFDGRLGADGFASSAYVAALTHTPVLLVVDVAHTSRTVGAIVHGLATAQPDVRVAGVILNRVGSPRHAAEARRAVEEFGVPVVGTMPKDPDFEVPSRHLGLVPAEESGTARRTLSHVAEAVARHVDLGAVLDLARSAGPLSAPAWTPQDALAGSLPTTPVGRAPVVAVSGGRAFTFRYAETIELLEAAGCVVQVFDPVRDRSLPAGTAALYLGGGFPEVHAVSLSHNRSLLTEVRDAVLAGMPTVAECAGLLYLTRSLDGHRMAAVVDADAAMTPHLTLGYRQARIVADSVLGVAGTEVTGHEFHRTRTTPAADSAGGAWVLDGPPTGGTSVAGLLREGYALDPARTGRMTLVASYLHTHWAGHPGLAAEFSSAAAAFASAQSSGTSSTPTAVTAPRPARVHQRTAEPAYATDPLDHHGDLELDDDLVNLAVNVRLDRPPRWLARELHDALDSVAAYPHPDAAREAIARRHQVPVDRVLLTNGADEAFTLLARSGLTSRPAVVQPQFTEPEAALRRAGLAARHVHLRESDGFALTATTFEDVPAPSDGGPDLVVIGNPTNPTGVLHGRSDIELTCAPGRFVVVDEAFMDAVPGEPESFLTGELRDDVIVVRSLTKTWGLAGLRVGYVVAHRDVIARLRACQPHWPVNHLATVAAVATARPEAVAEATRGAELTRTDRDHLDRQLRGLGVLTVPGAAPFVLARIGAGMREELRANGFAVRRGDTFVGLGADWVRIAARDAVTTDAFVTTLATLLRRTA